ncbi:MAG: DUF6320 domain-containing protein [Clostridiales bacterium]|nr:DUF6320 domain-containing protein [Clostridiales bacterium]
MSMCRNCGVQLRDPVPVCPLCKCIVEQEEGEEMSQIYPYLYAERGIKKMQLALNIYLFAAIAAEVILCAIHFMIGGPLGLLILIAAFLVYGFITLKVSIQMHTGYRLKMILQTLLGVAVLLVIDLETGFGGWSLNYVLPAAYILVDITIIVLMLVNNRNWQSYIPLQILDIVFCVIPFVLYHFYLVTNLIVPLIAIVIAGLTFAGTLIVGGKRARSELYRRFHV